MPRRTAISLPQGAAPSAHSSRLELRSAFVALFASRVGASLAYALLFAWFAREAGVAAVGAVGVIASISTFVAIVADSGLASLVSKTRAHRNDPLTAAALRLNAFSCVGMGAAMAGAVAVWAAVSGHQVVLALIAISSMVEMSTETCLGVPIADGSRSVPAQSLLIRRLGAVALFAVLLLFRVDAMSAYCFALASAAGLGQLHARGWIRRNAQLRGPTLSTWLALRTSIPYSISNLSAGVRYLDAFIVGVVTAPVTAGLYAAAARLVAPMQLVSSSITSVLLPHAATLEPSRARRLANRMVCAFLVLTLLALSATPLVSRLVQLLLGTEFAAATPVLQVLAVGFPVVLLTSPLGAVLQAQNHEGFVATNGAVFAVAVVAGLTAGASAAGAVGAAAGLCLAFALKAASLVWAVNTRLGGAIGDERQMA